MITKCKQQDVIQIMNWIQCFTTYIAIVSCAKPECVTDLIAYWNLIINSQRYFQGFHWVLYDCPQMKAATTSALQWDTTVDTLWNLSYLQCSTRPSTSQEE